MGSSCTQFAMGGSGPICLSTGSHLGQSGGEIAGLYLQENHSDCSMVAQHTSVLRPSGYVEPNPIVPTQSVHLTIQSDPSKESGLTVPGTARSAVGRDISC